MIRKKKIVGVDEKSVFQIMDKIANAISDSCEPQIIPNITFQTIRGKCVVIVEIYPGANRPYYIKNAGKEKGTYVRVAGTSRPADTVKIKELEMEGTNVSWDELVCVGYEVTEEAVRKLCRDITEYMKSALPNEEERKKTVQEVTKRTIIELESIKTVWGRNISNKCVCFTDERLFSIFQDSVCFI